MSTSTMIRIILLSCLAVALLMLALGCAKEAPPKNPYGGVYYEGPMKHVKKGGE